MLARFLLLSGVAVSLTAQTPAKPPAPKAAAPAAAKPSTGSLKTAWGDPNLQGTWFVTTDVPLERSAANANKEFYTEDEIAKMDAAKGLNPGRNARESGANDVSGAYNAVFNSVLKTGTRTSRIIDPPDGRIPALVNPPQPRGGGGRGAGGGAGLGLGIAPGQVDNPETAAQSPRCLGVPMPFLPLNTLFAQGTVMQVVQGPKSMAIYMEDDHRKRRLAIASSISTARSTRPRRSSSISAIRAGIGKAMRWSWRRRTSRKGSATRTLRRTR